MRSDSLILRDHFYQALKRHQDKVAVTAPDGKLTYRELLVQASKLANALNALGVGRGDKVVLLLRNSVDYVIADIAIILAGACKVPLNDMLAANDVGYMINHADAKAVISHTSFAPTINAIQSELSAVKVKISCSDTKDVLEGFVSVDNVVAKTSSTLKSGDTPDAKDPGLIIYTGGTTGKPKGVYHTQESLLVNFLSHLTYAEIRQDEHLLICSPLPHSAQQFVLSALLIGAQITIENGFDITRVLNLIETTKITWCFMVPTMIYRLLDAPRLGEINCSSLRTIVYGASPITAARLRQGLEYFGPIFLQIYGQTEVPNFVTVLSKQDHLKEQFQTSCGQPVMFCNVAIRDESGTVLEYGEVGEITVKSYYSLERYYKNPAKTETSYIGSHLRTGDVGYQHESGHVFLVDRANDMIISGGMNVYSTEVENVVNETILTGQVVVIGVPDDDWGEAVTAFIVGVEEQVDEDKIINHCKTKLAKYKVPKHIKLVDEIPLTPYGKPDKKALRAQFWGQQSRQIN